MNQKAYSILFCALLASTFVHELRAKGIAPVGHSRRLEGLERALIPETCEVVCQGQVGASLGLVIVINVNANLVGVTNTTTNAAIIFDFNANIVGLFNGQTGAAVFIDLTANTGVYFTGGVFVAANISFQAYIASLTGLKALLSVSGGVSFSLNAVPSAALQIVNQIVVSLVLYINLQIQTDVTAGITVIVAIAAQLIAVLKGNLNGFLQLVVAGVISVAGDLTALVNIFVGIGVIIQALGGVSVLIAAGVSLQLGVLVGANNGLAVLVNLLLQISGKVDIGAALGAVLNNAQSLFALIAQLGGNVSVGVTGVFKVLAGIVAYANKNITLAVLINTVITFVVLTSQQGGGNLGASLNGTLQVLLDVTKDLNVSALGGFVAIITALVSGTYVVNGINISAVIEILVKGVAQSGSALLIVVISLLLYLSAVVETGVAISTLVFVLFININTAFGLFLLKGLGIAIDISITGIAGSIIKFILTSVSGIIALLFGNIYDALVNIPVFGKIIVAVNVAVTAASSGSISLKALLTASAFFSVYVKALIQVVGGIALGVSGSVVAEVQALVKAAGSVYFYFGVSASVSASVVIGVSGGGGGGISIGK